MKTKFAFIVLIFSSLLLGCRKETSNSTLDKTCPDQYDAALIIGQDFTPCDCCNEHFWIVNIRNQTFLTTISDAQVIANITGKQLPIPVCIQWSEPEGACLYNQIIAFDIQF